MDLAAFYAAYRADGHGRAAYEPSMMLTLVLYAYATKQRSSRAIECHCRQDVAYRVITGNVVPDHATIARFVVRHEQALADLFGEVLRLCDQAGLVKPALIAIDGTRMAGNANSDSTRDFEQIARGDRGRAQGDRRGRRSSNSVTRVVMSCPNSCARQRADESSLRRPSSKPAPRSPRRSRVSRGGIARAAGAAPRATV